MNKKFIIIFLLSSVAALTFYLLWPSDESRVRKLFKEGAGAVESRDLDGVMSKISFNYRDEYGMTYLYIKETLKRDFEKFSDIHSDIHVEYDDLKVEVLKEREGERAVAELNVRVVATAGNETGYIIGDVKKPLHLKFTLRKERLKWLIVMAEGFEF